MPINRRNTALVALLIAGCTTTTTPSVGPSTMRDCNELVAAMAATDEARQAARDKQQGAWKIVIPVAVAARYATGKAQVAEAGQRRAELERELEVRGCPRG
jgi:hypothetical protein